MFKAKFNQEMSCNNITTIHWIFVVMSLFSYCSMRQIAQLPCENEIMVVKMIKLLVLVRLFFVGAFL